MSCVILYIVKFLSELYFFVCFLKDNTRNGTSLFFSRFSCNTCIVILHESDVIGILDSTGTLVVQYTYDAWGKILSVTDGDGVAITNKSHVAYLNPIRYRGYVYDEEIGMYYLQSRYYDPTTGRFINQDMAEIILEDQGFLGQYNLVCVLRE